MRRLHYLLLPMLAYLMSIALSHTTRAMDSQQRDFTAITIRDEEIQQELASPSFQQCRPQLWMFKAAFYGLGVLVGMESCVPLFFGEVEEHKNAGELVVEGIMAASGACVSTLSTIELIRIFRDRYP